MPPAELWGALSRTGEYPAWWSWLRTFEASGLEEGVVARCVVRAPLPYSLRFDVHVDRVVPDELVEARVEGDITGPARLEVTGRPDTGGSDARLVWAVQVRDPLLRSGAVLARPLMEWGHEWVVATGVNQFRRRAFRASGSCAD